MNGALIALIAQLLLGVSFIVDKLLLKRTKATALSYAFWIGILSLFGLAALGAGFDLSLITFTEALLALATGGLFLLSLILFYKALEAGEASQTLPVIGGFAPMATIAAGLLLTPFSLNVSHSIAFAFLTIGGLLMFVSEKLNFKKIFPWVILAAATTGLVNVLEKEVFTLTNFATGFVLIKAGTLLAALGILAIPAWRRQILQRSKEAPQKHRILYLGNRLMAGIASLLILYAISLGHPALIESLSGVRYVVVFAGVYLITVFRPKLLKEHFGGWTLAAKLAATVLILIGLAGMQLQSYYETRPVPDAKQVTWGVTFSPVMSNRLGTHWHETYQAILNDLKPRGVRLLAYWSVIQRTEEEWNFADLDWQVQQAADAGVPVILAVGQKVPRWPECHFPDWVPVEEAAVRQEKLLRFIGGVVERYRDAPNLLYWQVENEPFLKFGECPPNDPDQIDREVALVRALDPKHPVLMTDGGEFGDWVRAAKRGDVFGTTLYQRVYSDTFGHFTYPLTPEFYPLKEDVTRLFTGKRDQKIIAIEVGLEPWTKKQIWELTPDEQRALFSLKDFHDSILYARQARFDTYYLWGAEWWYWLKTQGQDPSYWDFAKGVFAQTY